MTSSAGLVLQDPVSAASMPWLHIKSLSLGSCSEGYLSGGTHPQSEVLESTPSQSKIGIVKSMVSELESSGTNTSQAMKSVNFSGDPL